MLYIGVGDPPPAILAKMLKTLSNAKGVPAKIFIPLDLDSNKLKIKDLRDVPARRINNLAGNSR
jgi:hypothetical protein